MKKALFIISVFIFAMACKNKDNTHSKTSKSDRKVCALVTEEEIKDLLAIPKGEVTKMEEAAPTQPTCFYTWESVIYIKTMNISGRDLDLEYPAKASIVLVENANEGMYQASIKAYKEPQVESGIGDMAIWGTNLSQITFLAKGNLVHVNVQVTSDAKENRDKAIQLAKLVIDRL